MRVRELPMQKKIVFLFLYVKDHFQRFLRKTGFRLSVRKCGENLRIFGKIYLAGHHRISVGDRCAFNHGVMLMAPRADIEIGDDVVLSPYVVVTTDSLDNSIKTLPRPHFAGKIMIKDGAWVGTRATILPGVTIGENAVVAAGAIVRNDVPAGALVAGVPATIKKARA